MHSKDHLCLDHLQILCAPISATQIHFPGSDSWRSDHLEDLAQQSSEEQSDAL